MFLRAVFGLDLRYLLGRHRGRGHVLSPIVDEDKQGLKTGWVGHNMRGSESFVRVGQEEMKQVFAPRMSVWPDIQADWLPVVIVKLMNRRPSG